MVIRRSVYRFNIHMVNNLTQGTRITIAAATVNKYYLCIKRQLTIYQLYLVNGLTFHVGSSHLPTIKTPFEAWVKRRLHSSILLVSHDWQ